jgi:hypothetical protein
MMAPPSGGLQAQAERLSGEVMETEGEFDPRDFDITSSVSELPGPRGRASINQPLPAPSNAILPETRAVQKVEPPREYRAPIRRPTSKVLMPPSGH